jgi:hypothetical protein
MSKNNPKNERIKRQYFGYLKEAIKQSDPVCHPDATQALLPMARLAAGLQVALSYSDAEYFNLSDKDTRIATAQREQRVPTLEQIKHVIQTLRASPCFSLATVSVMSGYLPKDMSFSKPSCLYFQRNSLPPAGVIQRNKPPPSLMR